MKMLQFHINVTKTYVVKSVATLSNVMRKGVYDFCILVRV